MPAIGTEELLSRLKKGKPVPAILLLGDEPYLRDTCRAQLIDQYVPEAARTWAVSRFSAERGDVQAAVDQAQTLPMLSPQQVVFLEDAEEIEKFAEKKRDEAVKQLEAYLDDPAAFTVLVVEAAHLDQRMKLAKLFSEKSLVVEVSLGEDQGQRNAAAANLAKSLAKEAGVDFEKGAAEDLTECVGANLQRLKTELEKLSTFVGDRKLIRREDVAQMVISERAGTVWEMVDFIAARRRKAGARLSGPPTPRRRRASANAGGTGLDVPQAGGSQRNQRRRQRLAGRPRFTNGSGKSRASREKRAKDFKTTAARRAAGLSARRQPPQGRNRRYPRVDGISDYGADFAGSKCCKRLVRSMTQKSRTRVRPFLTPKFMYETDESDVYFAAFALRPL